MYLFNWIFQVILSSYKDKTYTIKHHKMDLYRSSLEEAAFLLELFV